MELNIKSRIEYFTRTNIESSIKALKDIPSGFPNKSTRLTVEDIIRILEEILLETDIEKLKGQRDRLNENVDKILKIELNVTNLDLLHSVRKLKSSGYIDLLTWALETTPENMG